MPAVSDAEWAVALAREAAAALFARGAGTLFTAQAGTRPADSDARADPARRDPIDRGSRESPLAYPTFR